MKHTLLILTLIALLLSACAPNDVVPSTGDQPTPVVVTETVPLASNQGYQPVDIDGVEVQVGEGSPIPVHVIASGNLPDTCAQIELVQLQQDGTTFRISLSTVPSTAEGCIQDTLPFKIGIPLNVVNLPGGSYTVDVNGMTQSFQLDTGSSRAELPSAGAPTSKDDIQVDDVNIDIGVGSPIPVHAIVSANLPGTCAQLGDVRMHRDGTTFYIRLIASSPATGDCKADSLPFRVEIPLNIVNLPEGPYEVNVNGKTASFDPRTEPADSSIVEDFERNLQEAVLQRDAEAMKALMGDDFILAFWQSEGVTYPAEEAVSQLLSNYVGEGSAIEFHAFQDIPGFDPQMMLGPDVNLAKAIFVTGWGLDARGEAVLFIARRPDESLYWHSVLVAPEGFAPPMGPVVCSDPIDVAALDGKVSYNGISFDINPAIAYPMAARICPEAPARADSGPGEAHPPYTEFFFPTYDRQNVDFQPQMRVYELSGDLSAYTFPLNMIVELRQTLEQKPEPVTWFKAPLHGREKYLSFANGTGVRGLVQYMQDVFFFTNNGLLYEFHGLTQDGRYFVSVRYPVSVPFLMELADYGALPPNNLNPQAIAIPDWPSDFTEQVKVVEAYNGEALRRLNEMKDGDAQPDLAQLDALVQSIRVDMP
jgi:hypothetical protein